MRYAILFSGMSFRRHVNGLEFCYRTLIDRLGFLPRNIQVLSYDGSLRAFGDPEGHQQRSWPGDGTPYRMPVNAPGSREALQQAIRSVGSLLQPQDQLVINTSGHGSHQGTRRGPDLVTFPYCQPFKRGEFCAELAALPPHRSLVVLMSQCFSGGFNQSVLDASRADSTVIASATAETLPSFASPQDLNWDSFQRNWIAALAGRDVDGTPLQVGARTHEAVSVREAFDYANSCSGRSPYDSPQFSTHPPSAGDLTLTDTSTAVLTTAA